jgi:hypothetical protein
MDSAMRLQGACAQEGGGREGNGERTKRCHMLIPYLMNGSKEVPN